MHCTSLTPAREAAALDVVSLAWRQRLEQDVIDVKEHRMDPNVLEVLKATIPNALSWGPQRALRVREVVTKLEPEIAKVGLMQPQAGQNDDTISVDWGLPPDRRASTKKQAALLLQFAKKPQRLMFDHDDLMAYPHVCSPCELCCQMTCRWCETCDNWDAMVCVECDWVAELVCPACKDAGDVSQRPLHKLLLATGQPLPDPKNGPDRERHPAEPKPDWLPQDEECRIS